MLRNWLGLGVGVAVVSAAGLALVAFTHLAAQPAFTARLGAPWDGAGGGPASRALSADTVVVGKVLSFEKETVEALGTGSATPSTMPRGFGGGGFDPSGKVKYTVANVKIEDGLIGAKTVTHVKVGFVKGNGPELAEGGQYLLFLSKHPTEAFFIMPARTPAVSAKDDEYKKTVAEVTKVAGTLADPVAALKAEKAADRGAAAVLLLNRYRGRVVGGFDEVELSAEESRLLLKGLADADWTATPPGSTGAFAAFLSLRLTEKDGWKLSPTAKTATSARVGGANDVYAEWKKAFAAWIDGAGKDYKVKKLVPKK